MTKKLFLLLGLVLFTINLVSASGSMIRNSSVQTVSAGSSFTLTYTSQNINGNWGASIQDSVSGGCTFPDGTNQYKSVMLSSDGNTKTIILNADTSGNGYCTFYGDYKVGTDSVNRFQNITVFITGQTCTPSWSCNSWSSCINNQQTRICSDTNNCNNSTGKPSESQTCSITCTPSWSCSSWNSCSGGSQERTCSDINNCGINSGKPSESQTCSSGGSSSSSNSGGRHYYSGSDSVTIDNSLTEPRTIAVTEESQESTKTISLGKKSNAIPITGAVIGTNTFSNIIIIFAIIFILLIVILSIILKKIKY